MTDVLIIDDSSFIAKTMKQFMEGEGYKVVATGKDGLEGVSLYKEHKPDLVTLDITMPNKDGRECLKDIMLISPEARVIMVSAVKENNYLIECLKNGAKGFVEKPLKFNDPEFCEEFRETIRDALEDD